MCNGSVRYVGCGGQLGRHRMPGVPAHKGRIGTLPLRCVRRGRRVLLLGPMSLMCRLRLILDLMACFDQFRAIFLEMLPVCEPRDAIDELCNITDGKRAGKLEGQTVLELGGDENVFGYSIPTNQARI